MTKDQQQKVKTFYLPSTKPFIPSTLNKVQCIMCNWFHSAIIVHC